jgi:hypothetical protein
MERIYGVGCYIYGVCQAWSSVNPVTLVWSWRKHLPDLEEDDLQGFPNREISMSKILDTVCIVNIDTLKSICFAYFHSIMKYGIIFGGNSFNSKRIFTLQKKIIRIMDGAKPVNLCSSVFKKVGIVPLPCEYIFSLLNFFVNNLKLFRTNSTTHSVNTRNKNHRHRPVPNLSCFQKGAYYAGIKIFNSLPPSLKTISERNEKFKVALKRYLNTPFILLMNSYSIKRTHNPFRGYCAYIV